MMASQSSSAEIIVGMGGWQLAPFNGVFYPSKQPKGFRQLEFYARYLDLVEVNATFYSVGLGPRNAAQWLKDVSGNRKFQFSVKLFQGFTHTMEARKGDVLAVSRLIEPLAAEEKLCALVIQFPHSFVRTKERIEYLRKLAETFKEFPMFVEFRHDSWAKPELFSMLLDLKLHLINVDLPAIRHRMPLTDVGWGGISYFRLMGRNAETWHNAPRDEKTNVADRYLYDYSNEESEGLFSAMNRQARKGNKTFVVFHNDPQANSLKNGFELRHIVEPKKKLIVPAQLVNRFPVLAPFTVVPNPEGLTLF
jgi:uncharacterized protein YecE (DUF72 family)